jgi:hypothetical protein
MMHSEHWLELPLQILIMLARYCVFKAEIRHFNQFRGALWGTGSTN